MSSTPLPVQTWSTSGNPKKLISLPTQTAAKITTITIARAKLLDELPGTKVTLTSGKSVQIPYDIDDLEVPDEIVRTNDLDVIRDKVSDAKDDHYLPLNWQNAGNEQYLTDLREYSQALKQIITDKVREAEDDPSSALHMRNVAPYTTIQSIKRQMGNPISVTLSISLAKMRQQGMDIDVMPRENDVVDIWVQYPTEYTPRRLYIGLITAITMDEKYGEITTMQVECTSLMKQIMINKMVTDKAVVSQFESGELAQPGISVWSTNAFAGSTVDEIYTSIMTAQLAMEARPGGGGDQKRTELKTESALIKTKLSQITADSKSLRKLMGTDNADLVDKALGLKDKNNKTAPDRVVDWVYKNTDTAIGMLLVEKIISDHEKLALLPANVSAMHNPSDTAEITRNKRRVFLEDTAASKLNARLIVINKEIKKINDEEAKQVKEDTQVDIPESSVDYFLDTNNLTTPIAFQLSYVPLISLMLYNRYRQHMEEDTKQITAHFSGKQLYAFDIMIRSAFRLFFSQLQTPRDVIKYIEQVTKFVFYETSAGILTCEIPRYNEFTSTRTNPDQFIIANPAQISFSRQDAELISRIDVKRYLSYLPNNITDVTAGSLITRHFTDASTLSRYGMRATDPIYNPNAQEKFSQAAYAALEVTSNNVRTRQMTVQVDGSRDYQIGRLYFITRRSLDRALGAAFHSRMHTAHTVDGYVGYLIGDTVTVTHGQVITHNLSFVYVRKAKLLMTENGLLKANFKLLPDITGLIRILRSAAKRGELDTSGMEDPERSQETSKTAELTPTREGTVYSCNQDIASLGSLRQPGALLSSGSLFTDLGYGGIHRTNLPPILSGYSKKASVGFLLDLQKGLTSPLIAALHFLDLRMRVFNRALLQVTPSLTLLQQQATNPTLMQNYLNLKTDAFKLVFLPSLQTNPFARLTSLDGADLCIVTDPVNLLHTPATGFVTGIVTGSGSIEDCPLPGTPISSYFSISGIVDKVVKRVLELLKITEDPQPGIVLNGLPARMQQGTTDHFSILQVYPTSYLDKITLGTVKPWPIDIIHTHRSRIKNFLVATGMDAGVADEQIDAALAPFMSGDTPSTTAEVFVPVVFRSTQMTLTKSKAIFRNYHPGIPFSILDTALLARGGNAQFVGAAGIRVDPNSGDSIIAHQRGLAIDVTLLPYYAKTGIVMNALQGSQDAPPLDRSGVFSAPSSYDQEKVDLNPLINTHLNPMVSSASTQVTQKHLNEINLGIAHKVNAAIAGVLESAATAMSSGALKMADVNEGDKGLYHLEVKLTTDKKKS